MHILALRFALRPRQSFWHACQIVMGTVLALLLTACSSGPDADSLRSGVEQRLAQALPAGTVQIETLQRRGSQADTKAPAGTTRRVVYYDAELKLARDFDFGGWDAPGVAGLISALGAAPKGVSGIKSGGNKAGDIIQAHGTALYQRDADKWVAVVPAGYSPSEAPAYATNAPQGAAAILEAMREVVEAASKDASPAQRAVIEQELTAANASIRARLARATEGYAIAAGAERGQYLRLVQALASDASARTRAVPLITRGGDENLRLLRAGKVSIALAQGDAALDAYEGKGNFAADGPFTALRAIGSLYPEPVHVLVRTDGKLASVADLRGKRIAIGEPGAASRTTALRVLEAHGLGLKDIEPKALSIGAALVALRQQEVDAVIQVIGTPADVVRDALAAVPLRLLPLSDRAIATLTANRSGYFSYTMPRGTYASQDQDVKTIATAALLLVGPGMSDQEIGELTRLVFGGSRDLAARGSAQGAQVSAATALEGMSVPQHLAAAKALDALAAGGTATGAGAEARPGAGKKPAP